MGKSIGSAIMHLCIIIQNKPEQFHARVGDSNLTQCACIRAISAVQLMYHQIESILTINGLLQQVNPRPNNSGLAQVSRG